MKVKSRLIRWMPKVGMTTSMRTSSWSLATMIIRTVGIVTAFELLRVFQWPLFSYKFAAMIPSEFFHEYNHGISHLTYYLVFCAKDLGMARVRSSAVEGRTQFWLSFSKCSTILSSWLLKYTGNHVLQAFHHKSKNKQIFFKKALPGTEFLQYFNKIEQLYWLWRFSHFDIPETVFLYLINNASVRAAVIIS